MAYYVDSQPACLAALADQRAALNPDYAKAIIKSYCSGKLARGKGILEVGYKLDLVERELVAMRFPNFGRQIIEVRRELGLKESRIFVARTNATTSHNASSSSSSSTAASRRASAPTQPRAPVTRVPHVDGASTPPPMYTSTDPNPDADLARAILASLTSAMSVSAPEVPEIREEGVVGGGGGSSNGRNPLEGGGGGASSNSRTSLEVISEQQPQQPSRSSFTETARRLSHGDVPSSPSSSTPPRLPARNSRSANASSSYSAPVSTLSSPPSGRLNPPKSEDPLHLLTSYSTIFLIDDSTSMAENSLWDDTTSAVSSVVPLASTFDPSGVEIIFLNSKKKGKCSTEEDVRRLFEEVGEPEGATPLGMRLEEVLLDYLGRLEREREKEERERERETVGDGASLGGSSNENEGEKLMPLNIIILTDGRSLTYHSGPRHNPFLSTLTDDPESVIVAACKRLDRGNFPLSQLGINFIQVGTDPEAREFLQELDDGLTSSYGGIRDIVDTVPWGHAGVSMQKDGKLLRKILLGGVNRRIDRRG
ncbi:hypothetical protein BDY24DRAFT_412392 [Mrakia frigida]|uniref:uncharacterized protein n=1 Tax=Mrakia frigida TaxID=29902 RepID=UPI003FCC2124